jgi:acylphosphatase
MSVAPISLVEIIVVMADDYASCPWLRQRNPMIPHTITLRIRGRVQGVGYRWSMREQALALGLTGWVRNRRDGSVEALVRGSEANIALLVAWAHRGPPAAQVTAVERDAGDAVMPLEGFEQLSTV